MKDNRFKQIIADIEDISDTCKKCSTPLTEPPETDLSKKSCIGLNFRYCSSCESYTFGGQPDEDQ